jgi:hypothetical protein
VGAGLRDRKLVTWAHIFGRLAEQAAADRALALLSLAARAAPLSCLDELGAPVPWWFILKAYPTAKM